MELRPDCVHFRGDRPCRPHKEAGLTCTCALFAPRGRRILLIKLGALGDVVRTTPVVRALKAREPASEITWVTHHPELLPAAVDHALPLSAGTLARLLADRFDVAVNLDKDREACGLLEIVRAGEKRGFGLEDGHCVPRDPAALAKYRTGLDDGLNRANRLSYVEEALAIAGLPFSGEEYLLPEVAPDAEVLALPSPRIGLNTGCGPRWEKRRWPAARWAGLIRRLGAAGATPILLGGPAEEALNRQLAATGAVCPPPVDVLRFAGRVAALDLLVTPVSFAAHLAIGYRVEVVLLNNVFNRREFELYGRGIVVEPDVPCLGCFRTACPLPCMETLDESRVESAIADRLGRRGRERSTGVPAPLPG